MKRLAPDLFDRRFGDLMEQGRARLPGLAPDWTDHNAHDPGITLMELLAWVTEAQLYALGRLRRDERSAYAALFGVVARGTEPARGLVWPDVPDAPLPAAAPSHGVIIAPGTVVAMAGGAAPVFRTIDKLLFVPAAITRLAARRPDGSVVDHTVVNARGGPAFLPFGPGEGAGIVLEMDVACTSAGGLFPARRADADGALWPIGVRADPPLAGAGGSPGMRFAGAAIPGHAGLTATLVTPAQRTSLAIAADSSAGLLRTGVLLLDLSDVTGSPSSFTLELRAPQGFERAPRLLRMAPNVLPVEQGQGVVDEVHIASGEPDWNFQLAVPGLRFGPLQPPLTVALRDALAPRRTAWRQAQLADSGPADAVYAFDAASGRVTFGNGVNGRIPPAGAVMLASYAVSDGEQGGVAAGQAWHASGFAGAFGTNVDVIAGGADATTWLDERREARQRARDGHALVTAADIETAALALPLLEVARAQVLPLAGQAAQSGVVTLVALRARAAAEDKDAAAETPRWLNGIRRRLAPRLPLATRLVVLAPRYRRFAVRATVDVAPGRDPDAVLAGIERALGQRLTVTGAGARGFGMPLSQRDLMAWMRQVDGVRRVVDLQMVDAAGGTITELVLAPHGLPRFDRAASTFIMRRPPPGTPR